MPHVRSAVDARELQLRAEARRTAVEALLALLDDSVPTPVRDQLRTLCLHATAERLRHSWLKWNAGRIAAAFNARDRVDSVRCERDGWERLDRALARITQET